MLTFLFAAIAVLAIAVPVCGASAHTSGILLLLQAVGDAALGIKAKGVLNGTDLNGFVSIVTGGHNFHILLGSFSYLLITAFAVCVVCIAFAGDSSNFVARLFADARTMYAS